LISRLATQLAPLGPGLLKLAQPLAQRVLRRRCVFGPALKLLGRVLGGLRQGRTRALNRRSLSRFLPARELLLQCAAQAVQFLCRPKSSRRWPALRPILRSSWCDARQQLLRLLNL